MTKSDRLKREKDFHDDRFGGDDSNRKVANKYYYATKHALKVYKQIIIKHSKNKKLLEYGCGADNNLIDFIKIGAKVTGIDISTKGILKAKEKIKNSKYYADYFVMDAGNVTFNDSSFDIVIGSGIIHHLDIVESYKELTRILKPDGRIVFFEPLGHNPFINLYRKLTPKMRTKDEHPLIKSDIALLSDYFHNVEPEYYSLFALLGVPFQSNLLYSFLQKIDRVVFTVLPFMKKYAWIVLIHAHSPKKNNL